MREISKNEARGIPTQQTENKRMHLKEALVKSKISLKKSLGFKAKLKSKVKNVKILNLFNLTQRFEGLVAQSS
ncbi:MAG: hypothetical protein QW590_03655 [Candidatus Bilamarchaeaceae archaeon]